ncbi:N-acetylglucosaminidase [Staphylococcus simiae]|uniref:N-acetylglucosaminidase n=1 Tax=Staphylococcus simiae TaxID=308354 RepID=UPI001A975DF6|nr:N-acetylglucosaminidase [Staphylococcus simiae]MBO1199828.1 N-acetylglucosaminidase [Staphylococcus simiae]MBO1201955.1 N-acetylglucosaminidase [Staphylococcus simiae]MBO1204166.1 N-acetylglucosaminidase [Staphylococcus simiae]MBO1211899.1 N-acetylglucosaminidase [Staphylococcus simiae]MBO1230404.1 N-acetylglucosaminidase [Staphylococcus simiae]
MAKKVKIKTSTIILLIIIAIFAILLVVNETKLFSNDINYTFAQALAKQSSKDVLHTKEQQGQFVEANKKDIQNAMMIGHKDNKLQYMDISEKVPLSEQEINNILQDKGVLKNQGKAFLEAQDKYEVNAIYLISHALVETGNGRSELAQGIKDGNKRYYNFFGIGAFDSSAVRSGKSYAKEQQWTSPSKAILGGAKFIRNDYFDNQQITLYQMRWNPKDPAQHQYASDIHWANHIAEIMDKYYQQLGIKKDDIRKSYYKT